MMWFNAATSDVFVFKIIPALHSSPTYYLASGTFLFVVKFFSALATETGADQCKINGCRK